MSGPTARRVTDDERRARLAVRHALAPSSRAGTVEDVVRAMTVLHATEPASVHLACAARSGASVADVERALYDDRSVVKQLAMRRTLFVFPRDLLPAAWGSASARVAASERARMVRDVEQVGLAGDGARWLDERRDEALAALGDAPDGLTVTELREAAPGLDVRVVARPTEPWSASRVLTHLGATGDVVRGVNTGRWAISRPRWTATEHWLGTRAPATSPREGYRELVGRWLATFGPGTEDDLVWWLGSTRSAVRTALADVGAVPVLLADDTTGWLLPDDLDVVTDPGPWAALLPVLDPTTMGWRGRDFYLGEHAAHVVEQRGNAGTTAWVDGRVVGSWVQDAAGAVRVALLEAVTAGERAALDEQAQRLTAWLDGTVVGTGYVSAAMAAQRAGT